MYRFVALTNAGVISFLMAVTFGCNFVPLSQLTKKRNRQGNKTILHIVLKFQFDCSCFHEIYGNMRNRYDVCVSNADTVSVVCLTYPIPNTQESRYTSFSIEFSVLMKRWQRRTEHPTCVVFDQTNYTRHFIHAAR